MLSISKILVFDGDGKGYSQLCELLREFLPENAQACGIERITDGQAPRDALEAHRPDLLFVDESAGSRNSRTVVENIRKVDDAVGVILLVEGRLEDLPHTPLHWSELGIDDVLQKGELTRQELFRSVAHAMELKRQRYRIQKQEKTLEDVLLASQSVLWSEAVEDPENIFVSGSVHELTGYAREEFESGTMKWLECVVEGDRERVLEGYRNASDNPMTLRYQIRRLDGRILWIEDTFSLREDPLQRGVKRLSGCVQDVTEQRDREIEMQRQENFLREIGKLAKIGGWRFDKQTNKVHLSHEVLRIHGLNPASGPVDLEEAVSFFPDEAKHEIKRHLQACVDEGLSYDQLFNFHSADGRRLITRARGEPIYEGKEIIGAWGVFQDITSFYQLQYENEIFYDLAVELTCKISKEGLLLWCNQKWEEVLDYKIQQQLHQPYLQFVHPEDRKAVADCFQEVMAGKELNGFEVRLLKKSGQALYFSCNAVLAPHEETVFVLARDISDLKAKEAELQRALLEANIANESKNQFLMVISHELRTPLNPILGCADLLMDRSSSNEDREMLKMIVESANHLSSVVSDILDISSIESGRISIQQDPFDLIELVEGSLQFMKARAISKGLHLEFEDHGQRHPGKQVVCVGDKRKVRQILINLIGNGLKFTREGKVMVELLPLEAKPGIQTVTIRVADTGIGIKEEDQSRIFNRFQQVTMKESREFQGQGLGLALCRELARLLDGDVTVASAPGEGSTFTVTLPMEILFVETNKPAGIGAPSSTRQLEGAVPPPSPSACRVLVVEDDPLNQTVLKGMLKRLQADFLLVENGLEALEAALKKVYDLILMDIQMPEMDGLEAARKIRETENPNQNTPIMAISAHAVDDVKRGSLKAGMNGFLEKPIEFSALREVLKEALAPKSVNN